MDQQAGRRESNGNDEDVGRMDREMKMHGECVKDIMENTYLLI